MIFAFFLIVLFSSCFKENQLKLSSKASTGVRYIDPVFDQVDSGTIKNFRTCKSASGRDTSLDVVFYQPRADTVSKRPFIIFIHGGAFLGGSENDDYAKTMCTEFAKRGYPVLSLGYRIGINYSSSANQADSATAYFAAIYRAVQDARAGIRFSKKNARDGHIDTSKIYVVGESAGAVAGLHAVFLDQTEVPATISSQWGSLDGPGFYDYPGTGSAVHAILNMEGAIADTAIMQHTSTLLLNLYGSGDPFYQGSGIMSAPPFLPFNGGIAIQRKAVNMSIASDLQSIAGAHGKLVEYPFIYQTINYISTAIYFSL